jgi:carboxynorspermidine decarboxylase
MAQDPTPDPGPERLAELASIPFGEAPSPAFIIHLGRLEENARLLGSVREASGARILLALKGFACHASFPLLRRHLDGTTASGLHEALLARDFFGPEVHVYSPAFKEAELDALAPFAHSLVFNSPAQLALGLARAGGRGPQFGLRVNPEHRETGVALYDPCAPGSRLGVTRKALAAADPGLVHSLQGLHFHTLCEADAGALERTVRAFEERFGDLLPGLSWVNFGGGHHITRPDYDIAGLVATVRDFRERHGLEVYLEPGEAVALHTGVLVATVLDIVETGGLPAAILDTSATCHLPDVLEMPYRPRILGAGAPGVHSHTYRLGGLSCLAGDILGDFSFPEPLAAGRRLVFLDMAHYTMVKTTTFNGVPLPAICLYDPGEGRLRTVRTSGYPDYRDRLA